MGGLRESQTPNLTPNLEGWSVVVVVFNINVIYCMFQKNKLTG